MNRKKNNQQKLIVLLILLGTHAFTVQTRVWSGNTEKRIEGTFEKEFLGGVMIRDKNGKSHLIRAKELSKADLVYIEHHAPPELEVDMDVNSRVLPKTEWTRADDKTTVYTFTAKPEKKSKLPYKGNLTAELFVIARERTVQNDSRFVLMSYNKKLFTLPTDKDSLCELTFPEIMLLSYRADWVRSAGSAINRGKDYLGWILAVSDQNSNLLTCDTDITVNWLREDLPHTIEKLRTLHNEHPGHFEDRHFSQSFKRLEPPRIPWFQRFGNE